MIITILQGKKYKYCSASFSPCTTQADLYFSFVSALQNLFIRDYIRHQVLKRIPLSTFPLSLSLVDWEKVSLEEEADNLDLQYNGDSLEIVLGAVGTKDGVVQLHKITSMGTEKIAQSQAGISFGGIVAVDLEANCDKILAVNESGEIFTFDLLKCLQ